MPLLMLLLPSFSVGQAQVTSLEATETKTATSAPSCNTSREHRKAHLMLVVELALMISDEDFSFLGDDDDAEKCPTNS
jgi:hypothetical protein